MREDSFSFVSFCLAIAVAVMVIVEIVAQSNFNRKIEREMDTQNYSIRSVNDAVRILLQEKSVPTRKASSAQ